MRKGGAFAITVFFCAVPVGSGAMAQRSVDILSLDEERRRVLKEFDMVDVPDLDAIRSVASEIFSLPVARQDEDDLENLAAEANRAADLIDYICDRYDDEYEESYQYDLLGERIQEKLHVPLFGCEEIRNEFLAVRDRSHFNLGVIYRDRGETMKSFLYFKDAFTLSAFHCVSSRPTDDCVRWEAEREMKKLLGIEDMESYTRWD